MPQIEVCAAIAAESPDELGQAIASLATATALLESLEASFPPKHQPPPSRNRIQRVSLVLRDSS